MEEEKNAAGLPADVFNNFEDLNCTLLLTAVRGGLVRRRGGKVGFRKS